MRFIETLNTTKNMISVLIISAINKMNKTKSSKLTPKSQTPMRLLFKMRANPHGVMRTLEDDSRTETLPNKSVAISGGEDEESVYEGYNNSRMKTEYSDRFGLFRRNNYSFHHRKIQDQKLNSPIKPIETDTYSLALSNQSHSRLSAAQNRDEIADKKSLEPRKDDQKLPEIREVPLTFEEIEDKIESMMTRRLNQCMEFKKKGDWVIDTELEKLIDAYKEVKTAKNPEAQEEDINLLTRRINMLEKLIAESMTESDIVKKYYLGKVANHHWKHHKTESFSSALPVPSLHKERKQEALVNTSNNQDSYQQPERAAYSLERRGNYSYNPDRHLQPLPRSSYNRDFLTYGAVKNMSSCKPSENECLKAASSAKIMNSSYRSNFIPKKAEKINIKELDACRDKIKNLPVIFGKRQKDIIAYNLASFFRLKQQNNLEHNKSRSIERIEAAPNPHHFTSESRKEFVQAVQVSPSQIKHKNLQRLKYSYKKELHV